MEAVEVVEVVEDVEVGGGCGRRGSIGLGGEDQISCASFTLKSHALVKLCTPLQHSNHIHGATLVSWIVKHLP